MRNASEDDPYLWLEDISGEAALAWVAERNAETAGAVTADDGFGPLKARLREVLDASDRIPYTVRRGAYLYNFWRDAGHVRGLWRRTTLESYRQDEPDWEVLLDVDALAEAEGEKWVWDGANVRRPDFDRALVRLSRDGGDAVVVREFDLGTREFVADGFRLPEAKTRIGWAGPDTVLVGTDLGPDSLTDSGYPRTVRRWRRGTPVEASELVYEGERADVAAWGYRDSTPGFEREFVGRSPDFFRSETHLLRPDGTRVRIDVPDDADAYAHRQYLIVTLKSPWLGQPTGSLLAFGFDAFLAGDRTPEVLFTPDARTALAGHTWTRNHLILETMRDVSTRIEVLTPAAEGGWTREPLVGVPELSAVSVVDTDPDESDEYFLDVSGFLQPSTLHLGRIGAGTEVLKQAPHRFDTTGLTVGQHFATSADGTRVPYFVIGPDRTTTPGPGPALLYGYGGFEVSLTPSYAAVTGRAWLERGGTYVIANIRGGGEYGPDWHQAALGAERPRAFEDFAAVAKDLVARGITTPAMLGAKGGSNGGLLMGAMLTRHPELFGAIVAQVPLLDMTRFHKLLAGASWIAEYGDPDDPADRPHLAAISPYHLLAADRPYPPVLLMTSTRDDRVHPGHARKTAARLRELGHRVLFYENTGGGHAGAGDNEQAAHNSALVHTYLWQQLAAPGSPTVPGPLTASPSAVPAAPSGTGL
ncbi:MULTISPECIES: prolyl oligopeptidase family serine peptidase [Streptomyces]|uniref:Prolyl endopeptidase n=1 Tax=Streptomyces venezuelae (strain ATCC 10712 / CBS 650.69 / DSM 40230 / JCM 4526 / NBRC 13096 / PD 04745) TaxID=953739 RepID=F2R9W1_STRVP|nr:prolyl oligopeptidase family serine peptidase [Streptomyces venezuelae]APE20196.1 S9 family peptidase [Streptomyces venezuelae]QER97596.1 S9 family peptidase [Streptomyces venezuelae ATCC 10712]CCA54061.1 Prolyl endopeptidase [Streptomyces venezuelae ATCC 10712]